jgi:hypothetical protein
LDVAILFDPFKAEVPGRLHVGEELQEPADFSKSDLVFPSGESLPRCWLDGHYKDLAGRPR